MAAGVRASFLFRAESYSVTGIDHNLRICSPVNRHWGRFSLGAVVNNPVNARTGSICLSPCLQLGYKPSGERTGDHEISFLNGFLHGTWET